MKNTPFTRFFASGLILALLLGGVARVGHAVEMSVTKTATPSPVLRGDTVHYTVTITNTTAPAVPLSNVQFTDALDANTTLVAGTIQVSPVAVDDSYQATGNVSISVPVGSGLLANDFLGMGSVGTITAFDAASANGGTVAVTTSGVNAGAFTYNPPRGFTGSDTFHYTLTNSTGSSIATVTVAVSNVIWFIDNSAGAAGNGTLATPYNALSLFNTAQGAGGLNPKAGDVIFIYHLAGNYSSGIALLSNQRLVGQGVALSSNLGFTLAANSAALPAAGTNPTLTNAGGAAIALGDGSTVLGVTVNNGTQTGITGTVNSATVDTTVSVTTTSGTGFNLGAGNGAVTFGAPINTTTGRSVKACPRSRGSTIRTRA